MPPRWGSDLMFVAHPQLALWATNMAARYAGYQIQFDLNAEREIGTQIPKLASLDSERWIPNSKLETRTSSPNPHGRVAEQDPRAAHVAVGHG
jgi:hypothetical protein